MRQALQGPPGGAPRVDGHRRRGRHRPLREPDHRRRRQARPVRAPRRGRPGDDPRARPAGRQAQRLRPLDVHPAGMPGGPRGPPGLPGDGAGDRRRASQPHPLRADDGAGRGHAEGQGPGGRGRLGGRRRGPRPQFRGDAADLRDDVDSPRARRCWGRPLQEGGDHPCRRPRPGHEHGGPRRCAPRPRPRLHHAGRGGRLPGPARRRGPRAQLGRRRGLGRRRRCRARHAAGGPRGRAALRPGPGHREARDRRPASAATTPTWRRTAW